MIDKRRSKIDLVTVGSLAVWMGAGLLLVVLWFVVR
jgi:hypothetical protein